MPESWSNPVISTSFINGSQFSKGQWYCSTPWGGICTFKWSLIRNNSWLENSKFSSMKYFQSVQTSRHLKAVSLSKWEKIFLKIKTNMTSQNMKALFEFWAAFSYLAICANPGFEINWDMMFFGLKGHERRTLHRQRLFYRLSDFKKMRSQIFCTMQTQPPVDP